MAHDGKVTAYRKADGKGLFLFSPTWLSESHLDSVQEMLTALFFLEMHKTQHAFNFLHEVFCTFLYFCALQGLSSHTTDTYETIKMDKKPIVWWKKIWRSEDAEYKKLYTVNELVVTGGWPVHKALRAFSPFFL